MARKRFPVKSRPVDPEQRFTVGNPCPVCGGHPDLPRGIGVRCWGFFSADGSGVVCMQHESGEPAGDSQGYYHPKDQWPTERPNLNGDRPSEQVYTYEDEQGNPLLEVVRTGAKKFRQRIPGHRYGQGQIKDVRRVPYRLPRLIEAVARGQAVHVVEGEKDVHSLEEEGHVATCNPGGAGKWRDDLNEFFRGADVVIVADQDKAGRDHARAVRRSLLGVADFVQIVAPKEGKDATDHLDAGYGVDQLVPIEDTANHKSGLTILGADLSLTRPFQWAWEKRVLLGYVNLLVGEEGIGKGNLIAWVAARITRGELPGDLEDNPSRVLFVGDEDSWQHVWVPRFEAAGADLDRDLIHSVAAGSDGQFDVQVDAGALRVLIQDKGYKVVYFDQLLDNLGYTNNWKDKEVRDALAPLRQVARETECAMFVTLHPNKRQGGSFRDRIAGTTAFNAMSRSSLLLATHPQNPDRVVLVRGKGNYSAEPLAFEFLIQGMTLKVNGEKIQTSRITETRESGLTREDLLDGPTTRRDSDSAEAQQRLSEMFPPDGEPRLAAEVIEQLEEEGLPDHTVKTARRKLGIKTWKANEFQGKWVWGWRTDEDRRRARQKAAGKPVIERSEHGLKARWEE